ncbi:MAG: sigma-70 family RNA polymerase sigma factor, partial [Phycisphaerae bacterium]
MDQQHSYKGFVERVTPMLHGMRLLARRYVATSQDADDLIQETLLRAWKHSIRQGELPVAKVWMFTILRNVARDWYRLKQRSVKLVPVAALECTESASEETFWEPTELPHVGDQRFREMVDDRVLDAIDSLDPVFREVIILSALGGLSY